MAARRTTDPLQAHLAVDEADPAAIEEIKNRLKGKLRHDFNIDHSTLEVELQVARGTIRTPSPARIAGRFNAFQPHRVPSSEAERP